MRHFTLALEKKIFRKRRGKRKSMDVLLYDVLFSFNSFVIIIRTISRFPMLRDLLLCFLFNWKEI